jgi:hypothetical protein
MTRKVFIESDFFICNDKKKDEFRRQLMRFLEIIFDTNVHTPTLDESAMYEAYSAQRVQLVCPGRLGPQLSLMAAS